MGDLRSSASFPTAIWRSLSGFGGQRVESPLVVCVFFVGVECMPIEFRCLVCGSPAVEFPSILRNDAPVKCQRCRTVICSLGEFRRQVHWQPSRIGEAAASNDETKR
jgi:hypothetical protein